MDFRSPISAIQSKFSSAKEMIPATVKKSPVQHPRVTKAIKQLLKLIEQKTKHSLQHLPAIKQNSFGPLYEAAIKSINSLAHLVLTCENVTHQDLKQILECEEVLAILQNRVSKSRDQQEIDLSLANEIEQQIDHANNLLVQVEQLAKALIGYQKNIVPLFTVGQEFCHQYDQDPLLAVDAFKLLVAAISKFEGEIQNLIRDQGEMVVVKLERLLVLQIEDIEGELEAWIDSVAKSLQKHVRRLKYFHQRSDTKNLENIRKQVGAIQQHIAYFQRTVSANSSPRFAKYLKILNTVLHNAQSDLNQLGKFESTGLKYGSSEWQKVVAETGDMPKGILNHVFTHLTSTNYLPSSKSLQSKQMRNVFVIGLIAAVSLSAASDSLPSINPNKQVGHTTGDSLKWNKHQLSPPIVTSDRKVPDQSRTENGIPDADIPISDDTKPILHNLNDEIIDEDGYLIPRKKMSDHIEPSPSIIDIVNPIIDGLGVAKNIIDENPDGDQLKHEIWKGVKKVNEIKKKIKTIEKKRKLTDPIKKEMQNLSKKLDVSLANMPSYNCSVTDAAFWLQQATQQVCKLQFLCDKIDNDPALQMPEVTLPEQFEDPYWKESSQLVHETMQLPARAPSDKIYANLISLYTPELDNAYIAKEKLDGLGFSIPLGFLVDTQKAYLEALKTHLEFSQSCPEGSCTNAADKFGSEVLVTDYALVKALIEKIEFAISLFSLDYLEHDKQIKKRFASLKAGENFFFVAGWVGSKKSGHAVIIEIEKDSKETMTLRLFNLGAGTTEQANIGLLGIPFTEIVEVNPKRMTGGAFAGFVNTIMHSDLLGDQKINPTFLHDVLRNALGGKISAQLVSSDLLRNLQYVGNCATTSTFAIFDKNLVSVGLAEKMRALTLFRATKAYYEERLTGSQLESGEERESRRRMLMIGSQATFEAIERAIEVGGIVGEGALELLTETQKIQAAVAELQAQDFGALQNAVLTFDKHPTWKMPKFDVEASKLYDPFITPKSSFKLRTPATPAAKPKVKAAPTKRERKFTLAPFKNHALEALIGLSKKQSSQLLPTNRAALITPLELDEVFALGFQDARNLMLAGNTATLKITDNLALFQENLADFLDMDRLQIVQTLLLNPTALVKNMATDTNLLDSIGSFCHTGRNIGYLVQSMYTESFFAYLSRTIEQTLNKISVSGQKIDASKLPNARDVFRQLIDLSDHETEISRLESIHAYRLKSFELHETLTAEELGELLSSINYLKTHGYPTDISMNVAEEISRVWELVENSHVLFNDAETANEILNEIALGINPYHQKCLWQIHPAGFVFTSADQTMQYDPSTGILDRLTLGSRRLPKALSDDPIFRAIVGNAENLYLDRISEKVYIYKDDVGNNYRFIMAEHGPVTQREYGKNWYQALDPKEMPTFPMALVKSSAWVDGGIFWAPLKDGQHFYYTSPQKALIVQFDKGKSSAGELVTPNLEKTGLTLIDAATSVLSKTIARIEDPKFVFSFAKAGSLAYVYLPRLGLEFGDSAKDAIPGKVLATKKLNGFGLAEGLQRFPFLGDFAHYLPLKKMDAKRRAEEAVLIPFLPFAQQETDRLKTPTAFKALPDSWKEHMPYFLYHVKGNRLLPEVANKPEAVQANLHLSMIFLSERRYTEALRYLTITDKILKSLGEAVDQRMIDSLVMLANFFSINDDMTPDAAAVRLHARAMIQRLRSLNLVDIDLQTIPCKDDYELYYVHVQRVSADLRLSKEKKRHLAELKELQEKAIAVPLTEGAGLTFPAPRTSFELAHPLSTFKGSQASVPMNAGAFRPQALWLNGLTAGEIVVTLRPLFLQGFPEAIVSLYTLLKEPQDIGLFKRKILARQFGLDPAISVEELKLSMTTLVELRYRYLIDRINVQSSPDFEAENKLSLPALFGLTAERDLLGALITVARGDFVDVEDFSDDVTKFHELAATLRTNPAYQHQIEAFDELVNTQTTDALTEALRLWEAWIHPKALPIPLGLERATEVTNAFIGPVLTEPLMQLAEEQRVSTAFDVSYAIELKQPAGSFGVDETAFSTIKSYFKATPIATMHQTSPFGKKALNPSIDREFNSYDAGYKQYLSNNAVPQENYQLLEEGALKAQANEFKAKAKNLNAKVARREEVLKALLNKFSEDPAQSLHKQVRFARNVKRRITVDDAKVGLARGWDIKYLKTLNPSLELSEIEAIYEQTITMQLEWREAQRLQRMVDAIDGVLTFDRGGDPWQYMIAKLLKLVDEKINYNPYVNQLFLLAETEYNIALWAAQIPAILNLAPKDRINALYELAMGQGKTDVIAPAVLAMQADGHTVPVFVTTEPLLPRTSASLQQRLDEGYSLEVRNIPTERRLITTADIYALHTELKQMRDDRIPLAWSSSDVQTLINTFIENWINPPANLKANELMTYAEAWQSLFGFMRTHFTFLGDEIHAVLDILTTYNFALGLKSPFTIEEREAVADFLAVYIQHESVADKISMPALKLSGPQPFTKEYFDKTIAPQMIDTLIARGITNDPRCKELFSNFAPEVIKKIADYLSSALPGSLKTENITLFPAIDPVLIDKLEREKAYQAEVNSVLKKLPLSDQKALSLKTKNQKILAIELKRLEQEYKKLNQRIYDFAAVQKESLRAVFGITSMAQFGKHYVMNRKGTGAIPADNGMPLWDSEFGNSLERLYYSAFLFSQQGIERDIIKKDAESFVEKFRARIAELLQSMSVDGQVGVALEDELTIAFKERYGSDFHLQERGFNDAQIDLMTKWVNAKPERQIPFIRDYKFPEQTMHSQEIETTTHMFPMLTKKERGFAAMTGTAYNRQVYPPVFGKVTLSPTIFMVTEAILRTSPQVVLTIPNGFDPAGNLDNLYSKSTIGPGSIIDSTGRIEKLKNAEYAKLMLQKIHVKKPHITRIAYYEGNTLMMLRLDQDHPTLYDDNLPIESLEALWDVSHNTGSNIIVGKNAHAFLIVGKHARLFEVAQSVMRLRGHGQGQVVELAVFEDDRTIIAEKLSKEFGYEFAPDQPLTTEQIIQYALLNEIVEEMDNNWRAIDMRMKMAVLEPLMEIIWNPKTPPDKALAVFNVAKPLFFKERVAQPSDQYGMSISKIEVKKAIQTLLQSWKHHVVLENIKKSPTLLANIDVAKIERKLEEIANASHGPLQDQVDSHNYLGQKQRIKDNVQDKIQLKTDIQTKQHEKQQEKTKLSIKMREIVTERNRIIPSIRRNPYAPRPVLPISENIFERSTYTSLSLAEATHRSLDQLAPTALRKIARGAAIALTELIGLDRELMDTLQLRDNDISVSLNLAPVWIDQNGVAPLYAPYNLFQKFASHALLIQDKTTKALKLMLVDGNDAEQLLQKMKVDRDSDNSNLPHEVNLTLYHLQSNRVIASGATPVELDHLPTQMRSHELLAQAKLLSGMKKFTKAEADYLVEWVAASGLEAGKPVERKPLKILHKFIFQMALNREETLTNFEKSDLAKVFIAQGITVEQIQGMLSHPLVKCAKEMRFLLFDRSLSPKEWLEKVQKIEAELATTLEEYAGQWSDIITPLLPVLFEIPEGNGIVTRNGYGFYNPTTNVVDEANERAIRRRVLMNTFFSSLADEYGAWRTAMPRLVGKEDEPSYIAQTLTRGKAYGVKNDVDLTYLTEAFADKLPVSKPSVATFEQLETMSELAHPVWGLPRLAHQFRGIASDIYRPLSAANNAALYMPEQTVATISDYADTAKNIAQHAIAHVDLVASLRAIDKAYEFERLHGVFAFLADNNLSLEARREYALEMLPRLYGEKFGYDMRFYTQFIPEKLTVSTQDYTEAQISNLLQRCYVTAQNAKDSRTWVLKGEDYKPSTEELSLALRKLAREAPKDVAITTSKWLNTLLATQPATLPWLDMQLFQMIARRDDFPLIHHQDYAAYFSKEMQKNMLRAFTYKADTTLSYQDVTILQAWELSDFDLYADLAQFNTLHKPVLTVYQKAQKWTAVFKANPRALQTPTQKSGDRLASIWQKILGPMAQELRAAPPTNEADKVSLRHFLELLDAHSMDMQDNTFNEFMKELADIRLAADYSFEPIQNRDFALQEIKKLASRGDASEDLIKLRVYFNFIPNYLLPKQEAQKMPVEIVRTLLSDLHEDSIYYPRFAHWPRMFNEVLAPFTDKGTKEQYDNFITWVNALLVKGDALAPMDDYAVLRVLNYPNKIEHQKLVKYVRGREGNFIAKVIADAGSSISGLEGLAQIFSPTVPVYQQLIYGDFDFFADLFELKTANRPQLSHAQYAKKMNGLVTKIPANDWTKASLREFLNMKFSVIDGRFKKAHPTGSVSNPEVSALVKALDDRCDAMFDVCTDPKLPNLVSSSYLLRRIADFAEPNENINIQKATLEYLKMAKKPFREKAYEYALIQLTGNHRNGIVEWVKPTFTTLVDSAQADNFSSKKFDFCFAPYINLVVPIANELLGSIKTVKPTLDYVLKKLWAEQEKIVQKLDYHSLEKYIDLRANPQRDAFIHEWLTFGKDHEQAKIKELITLADGRLDILTKIVDVQVNNPPSLKANELAAAITKYIAKSGAFTDLQQTASRVALSKLIAMFSNPPSDVESLALSGVVQAIDKRCDDAGDKCTVLELVADRLRVMSDFRGIDGNRHMQKAVPEFFKTPSTSSFKRPAYERLIKNLLKESVKDNTWMAPTFALVVDNFKNSQLTLNDQTMLTTLFDDKSKGGMASLSATIEQKLNGAKQPTPIMDVVLNKMGKNLSGVQHTSIDKYLSLRSSREKGKFIQTWMTDSLDVKGVNRELVTIFENDFDSLANLLEIPTLNKPVLNAKKLIEPLTKYILQVSMWENDKIEAIKTILQKLVAIDAKSLTSDDKTVLVSLVGAIDLKANTDNNKWQSLIDLSNKLRRVGFTNIPYNDVQKIIVKYFSMDVNSSPFAHEAYRRLLNEMLDTSTLSRTDRSKLFTDMLTVFKKDKLSPIDIQLLEKLFPDVTYIREALNAKLGEASQSLSRMSSKRHLLIDFFVRKLGRNLSGISFNNLNTYFESMWSAEKASFIDLWLDSLETIDVKKQQLKELARLANKDLAIVLNVIGITIDNKPILKTANLAAYLKAYLRGGIAAELQQTTVLTVLGKLQDAGLHSQADKDAISSVLDDIETNLESNLGLLKEKLLEMRQKMDFSGSTEDNLSKLIEDLLSDKLSFSRRIFYQSTLPDKLFKVDRGSAQMLMSLLNKVNGAKSKHVASTLSVISSLMDKVNAADMVTAIENGLLRYSKTYDREVATVLYKRVNSKVASFDFGMLKKVWENLNNADRGFFAAEIGGHRYSSNFYSLFGQDDFSLLTEILRMVPKNRPEIVLNDLLAKASVLIDRVPNSYSDVNIEQAQILLDFVMTKLPTQGLIWTTKLGGSSGTNLRDLIAKVEAKRFSSEFTGMLGKMKKYLK